MKTKLLPVLLILLVLLGGCAKKENDTSAAEGTSAVPAAVETKAQNSTSETAQPVASADLSHENMHLATAEDIAHGVPEGAWVANRSPEEEEMERQALAATSDLQDETPSVPDESASGSSGVNYKQQQDDNSGLVSDGNGAVYEVHDDDSESIDNIGNSGSNGQPEQVETHENVSDNVKDASINTPSQPQETTSTGNGGYRKGMIDYDTNGKKIWNHNFDGFPGYEGEKDGYWYDDSTYRYRSNDEIITGEGQTIPEDRDTGWEGIKIFN